MSKRKLYKYMHRGYIESTRNGYVIVGNDIGVPLYEASLKPKLKEFIERNLKDRYRNDPKPVVIHFRSGYKKHPHNTMRILREQPRLECGFGKLFKGVILPDRLEFTYD